jgi:hypothetical protein
MPAAPVPFMHRLLAAYVVGCAAGRWRPYHHRLHNEYPVLVLLHELQHRRLRGSVTIREKGAVESPGEKLCGDTLEAAGYLEQQNRFHSYFLDPAGWEGSGHLWAFQGRSAEAHHIRVVARHRRMPDHNPRYLSLDYVVEPPLGNRARREMLSRRPSILQA